MGILFNFKQYQPIDYNTWGFGESATQGENLKRLNLLNSNELNIWNKA